MADWKSYENKELNYKFSYPSDWTLRTQPKEGCGPVFWAPGKKGDAWITICTAPGGDTLEIVANTLSTGKTIVSSSQTIVDGHITVRRELKPEDTTARNEILVVAKMDKSTGTNIDSNYGAIMISLYSTETRLSELKAVLDKILPTFKFL